MKELKVFNNLSRSKEVFKTIEPGKVRYYSCGPTTYDFLHVGNARALVIGDLFHRILKTLGYEVKFVRNFTDVDDKIITRAQELKVDPKVHAQRFVDECLKDMDSLGMMPATVTPKVTDHMDEIIQMIAELEEKRVAYEVEGEVFYHVPSFADYGKLSKKKLEDLESGHRQLKDGSHQDRKKHASDFVLWKPAKEGEPFWKSKWGNGRPGWHIECSAMAKKHLGSSIDLHHGGVDLMFPHHENEIAQSEAANGCPFCTTWAHNEFLNFGTEKMSKSLGNVVTIRAFIEKYSGLVLRHILISVHYRARLEWSEEVIERGIGEVKKIHEFALDLQKNPGKGKEDQAQTTKLKEEMDKLTEEFYYEISNDFNSAGALGVLFKGIRLMKEHMTHQALSLSEKKIMSGFMDLFSQALGCVSHDPQTVLNDLERLNKAQSTIDSSLIDQLILERKEAKVTKNWPKADEIRDKLKELKVVLTDHPDGTVTWKIQG